MTRSLLLIFSVLSLSSTSAVSGEDIIGAETLTGELRLVVEESVPWSGMKDGGLDLELSLTMRKGIFDGHGWAFVSRLAASEHPVEVLSQSVSGSVITVSVKGGLS